MCGLEKAGKRSLIHKLRFNLVKDPALQLSVRLFFRVWQLDSSITDPQVVGTHTIGHWLLFLFHLGPPLCVCVCVCVCCSPWSLRRCPLCCVSAHPNLTTTSMLCLRTKYSSNDFVSTSSHKCRLSFTWWTHPITASR
jgi:hypothetical protein